MCAMKGVHELLINGFDVWGLWFGCWAATMQKFLLISVFRNVGALM